MQTARQLAGKTASVRFDVTRARRFNVPDESPSDEGTDCLCVKLPHGRLLMEPWTTCQIVTITHR
jgi:hypothetical protein